MYYTRRKEWGEREVKFVWFVYMVLYSNNKVRSIIIWLLYVNNWGTGINITILVDEGINYRITLKYLKK